MKFPTLNDAGQRRWKVDQSSDQGSLILATKNIQFDQKGLATLSDRTITMIDEDTDADFESPVSSYYSDGLDKLFCTDEDVWDIGIEDLTPSLTPDGLANVPNGSIDSSGTMFNASWVVSEAADLHSFNGTAWTDQTVSLTSGRKHPLCVHKGNNSLMVGNGPQVKQYNTSYSETTNLSLPTGLEVSAIAYNRNFAAVVVWDAENNDAFLFIWDGATAGANYAYSLGSNRAFFVAPFKDTFITLTGAGQLLYWTSAGLDQVAALPSFYTTAVLGDVNDTLNVANDTAWLVDGNNLLFNAALRCASQNSEKNEYNPLQPAGVWCYTPDVGLHHRYGHAGSKLIAENIPTADVNTTTNQFTLTSLTCPQTGTIALYQSIFSSIPELLQVQPYYVIRIDSTHFQLAYTYDEAIAGTPIDLTGTGDDTQVIAFMMDWDIAQMDGSDTAMLLGSTGPNGRTSGSLGTYITSIYNKYTYSVRNTNKRDLSDSMHIFGVVCRLGVNRGWLMTQKIFSGGVLSTWNKIYIKARHLLTSQDQIIVKVRWEEDDNMPIIVNDDSTTCAIWTDNETFTCTSDLEDAKTAFDAGLLYEIEFTSGAAAGYTAHIADITESGGTYTVELDEAIPNVVSGDKSFFVIDNWLKLKLKGDNDHAGMSYDTDQNYGEFPFPSEAKSKWVQFKIELRGYRVAIEEYELIDSELKPSL